MGTATQPVTPELVSGIYPLNQLAPAVLGELAPGMRVVEVLDGEQLFPAGGKPAQLHYLLDGQVDLLDDHARLFMSVTPSGRTGAIPLPPMLPTPHEGRTRLPSRLLAVDRKRLHGLLFRHRPDLAQAAELAFAHEPDEDGTWQEAFLHARGYRRLPPDRREVLFARLQRVALKAGESFIRQGEPADFFYILAEGRCEVIHRPPGAHTKLRLEECVRGASIGEDAIVAGTPRNATVTMVTDGAVMRLEAEMFRALVQPTLAVPVGTEQARTLRSRGARWLDLRMPGTAPRLREAQCVPFPLARARRFAVDPDAVYIVVCADGRESAAIAYMLRKYGLDAYYLAGGVATMAPDEIAA
jgi:CRP-like cAMP-binding protein